MDEPLDERCDDGDAADRELAAAALKGGSDALDALVRRHQGFLYGIAVRMLWDPCDAEDVTQEILIKIVTGLASFRGESAFRSHLGIPHPRQPRAQLEAQPSREGGLGLRRLREEG